MGSSFYRYRVNAGHRDGDVVKATNIKAFSAIDQAENRFVDMQRRYAYVELIDIETGSVLRATK